MPRVILKGVWVGVRVWVGGCGIDLEEWAGELVKFFTRLVSQLVSQSVGE